MTAGSKPRITLPEDAEPIRPFGIEMKVLLSADDTGGSFSAIVAELKPGEGPPPHLHRDRDEYFYVLEGTYKLSVGDQEATAGPGALIYVPRNTVHSFSNVASTTGRILEWTIPGGNERYFKAVYGMEAKGFDLQRLAEINRQFETEFR